jgi:hypothetical protein
MRVKVLEKRLRDTDTKTGVQHDLSEGDEIEVSDVCGIRWCAYGWAKDLSELVATGDRQPGARQVVAQNVKITKPGGR